MWNILLFMLCQARKSGEEKRERQFSCVSITLYSSIFIFISHPWVSFDTQHTLPGKVVLALELQHTEGTTILHSVCSLQMDKILQNYLRYIDMEFHRFWKFCLYLIYPQRGNVFLKSLFSFIPLSCWVSGYSIWIMPSARKTLPGKRKDEVVSAGIDAQSIFSGYKKFKNQTFKEDGVFFSLCC